jgi:hypothetical protein
MQRKPTAVCVLLSPALALKGGLLCADDCQVGTAYELRPDIRVPFFTSSYDWVQLSFRRRRPQLYNPSRLSVLCLEIED